MKYSELERKLADAGCYCVKTKGPHPKWYSPITGKEFDMSHHGKEEVRRGTLKSISRFSGVKL
ncbi:MAG: type II toxin-antitoxin system HicA family toxin [Rikenellaceae bacterium]|jgi:predicted RNA binding protein YcfA (HicA-like mRNA interferase family)|nr:type II toxin-antitoxin system HicA family toxin [Rikenellaceae bacterium]